MNEYARVFLNSKEERELLQGFPWVFDNEISHVKYQAEDGSGWKDAPLADCAVKDGNGVEVFTKAGGFVATGIINRTSKITVRIISQEHADKVFADTESFWEKKIRDAYAIRHLHYSEKDSYRLIFGEADFIPGFIAERFCNVSGNVILVVQFLSLSCDVFRDDILAALHKVCRPAGIYERDDADIREKEGLLEILVRLIRVLRNDEAAAGRPGIAAPILHLLDHENLCPGVMRRNRGGTARSAVADHEDIGLGVPVSFRFRLGVSREQRRRGNRGRPRGREFQKCPLGNSSHGLLSF